MYANAGITHDTMAIWDIIGNPCLRMVSVVPAVI